MQSMEKKRETNFATYTEDGEISVGILKCVNKQFYVFLVEKKETWFVRFHFFFACWAFSAFIGLTRHSHLKMHSSDGSILSYYVNANDLLCNAMFEMLIFSRSDHCWSCWQLCQLMHKFFRCKIFKRRN